MSTLYTIGFAGWNAQAFFPALQQANVRRVIDVRLNNRSQLAGFTKRDDLAYFLRELCGADYVHMDGLAPTKDILTDYRKEIIDWNEYTIRYTNLLQERDAIASLDPLMLDNACLLCSEHEPEHCHRDLAAQAIAETWPHITVEHLV